MKMNVFQFSHFLDDRLSSDSSTDEHKNDSKFPPWSKEIFYSIDIEQSRKYYTDWLDMMISKFRFKAHSYENLD